jgi:RHS repeat-associated protein
MMRARPGASFVVAPLILGLVALAAPAAADGPSVDSFYGSFATEVPVAIPEFHNLSPNLKLMYSSATANGWVGMGWSLAGSSFVTRASAGKGTPRFDGNDIFVLDGQELVPCTTFGGTHCTKIQSYQRITFDGTNWYAWRKDGTKLTYSPQYGTGWGVYRWALSAIQDPRGNTVTLGYWCDPGAECYLDAISYNGTTVKFYSEGRPDPITYAIGPQLATVRYRLKTIDVVVGGQRARAYRLNYTTSAGTGRSLLQSVQQFGRDAALDGSGTVVGGSALPAMSFSYQGDGFLFVGDGSGVPGGGYFAMGKAGQTSYQDGGVRIADVNGDGRDDLIWALWECDDNYGAGCQAHRETWLRVDGGWVAGAPPPGGGYFAIITPDGAYSDGGLRVADVNGDGKADLLWALWECDGNYGAGCQAHREVWLSTGTGWAYQGEVPSGGYFAMPKAGQQGYGDGGLRVADVNGDGMADLIWALWECDDNYGAGCQAHREVWLSTGTGWTYGGGVPGGGYFAITTPNGAAYSDGGLRVADVNGDGMADLIWALWECDGNYGDGCQGHRETWLSTPSGWVAGAAPPGGGYFAMTTGASVYSDGGLRLADVNGDGKADLIWALWECDGNYGDGCQAHRETWLSTGAGWVAGAAPPGGGYFAITTGASVYSDGGLRLADVNGDGKADLIWALWECDGNYGAGCQGGRETWLSTGSSWTYAGGVPGSGYFAITTGAPVYSDGGLRFGDFDGDGKQDLMLALWECDGNYGAGCQAHRELFLSRAGTDLLTGITSNSGGTTAIGYVPSSRWANTAMASGLILQTVATVTTGDGRGASSTTTYRYEGGLWSGSERRFLGFRKVSAVIDAAGNYTETYYHQHVGCISKPEATYYRDPAGNLYSYSTYGYAENASPPYTSLLTDRWDYECNQSGSCRRILSQIGYDAYGNATTTYEWGDYDVGGDERTAVRGYYANWSAYIVGLPAYENVYAGIGTGGALMKQTLNEYDGNTTYAAAPTVGNLARVKSWDSSTGGYATVSYGYDAWGNKVQEWDPAGNLTTYQFDGTYHTFNVGSCSAVGHCASRAWDVVLGVRTSETDVNGGTTSWAHDAFGRVVQETLANGHVSTHQYLDFGNPSWQRTRSILWDGTSDGLWEEVYQDGLGRKYKNVKKGGFTKELLFSDASTRVWQESGWYGPGETPRYEVYAYDGAGRLRTVTHPDGAVAQRVYGNGYTLEYDELGHERVVWKDAYGRVSQVRERNGGAYAYTTRQYDVLGRLVRTVDAAGNQTTAVYDSLGRKYRECTPDTGCTGYAYDAASRLAAQTDAKGQTIWHRYDALGRIVQRTTSTGEQATFTYDEAGHGASKGRLTSVSNAAASESTTFDVMGRVAASTRCVSGICYSVQRTYDALGRLATVTYPDGETVTYGYDVSGRLASVSGYVNSFSYDARGRLLGATYANGTTGSFAYDPNRQWLTSAAWNGPGGALYQASYGYDADARLTAMSSTTNPLSNVSFGYDELHRLTSVGGAQSQAFAYDWTGNMTSNSALGAYAYGDGAHRHAVTAAGAQSYSYDANGNMVAGAGRTIAWDAENRPVAVTKDGQTTTFAYDALGARVVKSGPAGATYYFGSLLEVGQGGLTKYYFAGPILVAKRDATGPYWYHQDHLSSVRAITNAAGLKVRGYDYAPYGAVLQTAGATANTIGWGGHRLDDETGLVFMNARTYDPQLGRFISADGVVPDEVSPQALDRYAFGYDNPIANVDPTGHAPVVAAVIAVAAVAASSAPAWVMAVAVVGAACTVAGYVLKDPLLMTIGSIALGFAGGFAGGAGFLAGPGLAGGIVGASVAAITSPLSPLDPGLKQAIGWAYTAQGLIHSALKLIKGDEDLHGAGGSKEGRSAQTAAEAKAKVDQLLKEHPEGIDAKLTYGDIMSSDTATKVGLQHSTLGLYDKSGNWLGEIGGNPGGSGLYLGGVQPGHANSMWTISNVSKDQLYRAIDAAYSVRNAASGYGYNWVCHNVAARISRDLGRAYDWSLVGGGEAAWAEFGYGTRYWGWNWSAGSGLNALLMLGEGAAAVSN